MSDRGAIHPNEAATDYRFRMVMGAAYSSLDPATLFNATAELHVNWGSPTLTQRIKVKVAKDYTYPLGVPTEATVITISHPWGADTVVTTALWDASTTIDIQMDGADLNVETNCDWDFTFSEIRVYVDTVLKKTIASNSDSGTADYNLRYNFCKLVATSMDGFAMPTCLNSYALMTPCTGETYGTYVNLSDNCSCSVTGGWQRKVATVWTSDTTKFKYPTAPSAPVCGDCIPSPTLPSFETGHANDSWYIVVASYYENISTKVSIDTYTCYCTYGTSYQSMLYWKKPGTFKYYKTYAEGLCSTSNLLDTDYVYSIDCDPLGSYSLTDNPTETTTYNGFLHHKQNSTYDIWCRDLLAGSETCLEGMEGENLCLPVFPDEYNTICCTTIDVTVDHPTTNCDNPTGACLEVTHDMLGKWCCFFIDETGVAKYLYSNSNHSSSPIGPTTVVADAVWLSAVQTNSNIFLYVLLDTGVRKKYMFTNIVGGPIFESNLTTTMLAHKHFSDPLGRIMEVYLEDDNTLWSSYDGATAIAVGLSADIGTFDITYAQGAFVLTVGNGSTISTYITYSRGESWINV